MQNLPRGASPPYFNYQLTMRHYPMANSVKRRPASPEALAQPALPHVFSFNPPTNLPSYLKNHLTPFPSSAVSRIPRNYPRFPRVCFFVPINILSNICMAKFKKEDFSLGGKLFLHPIFNGNHSMRLLCNAAIGLQPDSIALAESAAKPSSIS